MKFMATAILFSLVSLSAFSAGIPTDKTSCILTAWYPVEFDGAAQNSITCDGIYQDLGRRPQPGNLSYWISQVVRAGYQLKTVVKTPGSTTAERATYEVFFTK